MDLRSNLYKLTVTNPPRDSVAGSSRRYLFATLISFFLPFGEQTWLSHLKLHGESWQCHVSEHSLAGIRHLTYRRVTALRFPEFCQLFFISLNVELSVQDARTDILFLGSLSTYFDCFICIWSFLKLKTWLPFISRETARARVLGSTCPSFLRPTCQQEISSSCHRSGTSACLCPGSTALPGTIYHWHVGPAIIQRGPRASTVLARLWRAAQNTSGVVVPGQWRWSDRRRFAEATAGIVTAQTAVQLEDTTNTSAQEQQSCSTNWT